MADPAFLVIIIFSFGLAGLVKGIVGLGLPTVSLGLMTLFVDLPTAMVVLVLPALITNIWQAVGGGHFAVLYRRLWPFLIFAVLMVPVGTVLFVMVDAATLERILGGLLMFYAVTGLVGWTPSIRPDHERLAGIACGVVNGVLTGLAGTLFIPGVAFLQALGLPRDQLVQAMGMLFAAATASLGTALYMNGLVPHSLGVLSAIALGPALVGMYCGQRLRRHVPEPLFRRVFLVALAGIGCYISLS
jgi:uncharacterized membrane protein YfcA